MAVQVEARSGSAFPMSPRAILAAILLAFVGGLLFSTMQQGGSSSPPRSDPKRTRRPAVAGDVRMQPPSETDRVATTAPTTDDIMAMGDAPVPTLPTAAGDHGGDATDDAPEPTAAADGLGSVAPASLTAERVDFVAELQSSPVGFVKGSVVRDECPPTSVTALDGVFTRAVLNVSDDCGNDRDLPPEQTVVDRCATHFDTLRRCEAEPTKLGMFTDSRELHKFARFPVVAEDERSLSKITAGDRAAYWGNARDPFDVPCQVCRGTLTHQSLLYAVRRWWSIPSWMVYTSDNLRGRKLPLLVLGLTRTDFVGTTFKPMADEPAPAPGTWTNVSLESIDGLTFCVPPAAVENLVGDELAFVAVSTRGGEVHTWRFALPAGGAHCLWRTLSTLFLHASSTAEQQPLEESDSGMSDATARLWMGANGNNRPEHCDDREEGIVVKHLLERGATASKDTSSMNDRMPQVDRLPYLPCHRPHVGSLVKEALAAGQGSQQYLNFWPVKCDKVFAPASSGSGPDDCPGMKSRPLSNAARASTDAPTGARVAVCLSGFVRSFAFAKSHIFSKLVHPHNADVYGATWNVLGRVKKGQPITAKMMTPVPNMLAMLTELMQSVRLPGMSDKDVAERYQVAVHDYRKFVRYHALITAAGFPQASMYQSMQQSLLMMLESGKAYDVVIRTRWDVYVAVPLLVRPLLGSDDAGGATGDGGARYVVDVGAHCKVEGAWFPRRLIVEEGRLLRHIADTRFKLFGWQSCDFMDIAPYATMKRFALLFDWIRRYNVYSIAQWVEHAFLIDQGLAYSPVQLFLCLQRHGNKFFC